MHKIGVEVEWNNYNYYYCFMKFSSSAITSEVFATLLDKTFASYQKCIEHHNTVKAKSRILFQ